VHLHGTANAHCSRDMSAPGRYNTVTVVELRNGNVCVCASQVQAGICWNVCVHHSTGRHLLAVQLKYCACEMFRVIAVQRCYTESAVQSW
jgi:hypothetical protein